jgi:hypothetical protein
LDIICEDVTFAIINREANREYNKNRKIINMKKFALIFALFTFVSIVATAQPQLSWRFANAEVINAGTQLQFDVEVMASTNGSFHRDLQIYFDYSNIGFGSNIVAGGGISWTPLALMNTHYTVVNMADNTSSKFAIITEANDEMTQPGSSANYNEVTTSYQGLLRFTIDIVSNTAMAGIAFDEALMNGGQYYQSTSNTDPLKYTDPCLYDNDLSSFILSTLYGNITYANATSDPLSNCTVTINDGGVVGMAMTDVNGDYNYSNIADGAYTLTTTCSLPYTYSTNVGDANVVINHILGSPLTGIFYLAGNVNGDASIDVSDLNLMVNNILGVTAGYPISDWVFEDQPVNVSGGIGMKDYQGLMAGDADGSY